MVVHQLSYMWSCESDLTSESGRTWQMAPRQQCPVMMSSTKCSYINICFLKKITTVTYKNYYRIMQIIVISENEKKKIICKYIQEFTFEYLKKN